MTRPVTTAAIAGIGATEFSKDSGRSELRLAAEAVRAALDDAGLARPTWTAWSPSPWTATPRSRSRASSACPG